jgi:L-fuconate dehydratase
MRSARSGCLRLHRRSRRPRAIEYVDRLHEHFTDPVQIRNGCYIAPIAPGMSAQLRATRSNAAASRRAAVWADDAAVTDVPIGSDR